MNTPSVLFILIPLTFIALTICPYIYSLPILFTFHIITFIKILIGINCFTGSSGFTII